MCKWIKCSDKMPESGDDVLIYTPAEWKEYVTVVYVQSEEDEVDEWYQ